MTESEHLEVLYPKCTRLYPHSVWGPCSACAPVKPKRNQIWRGLVFEVQYFFFCLFEGQPDQRTQVSITYKNWRGDTAKRLITPVKVYWGANQFHHDAQWLLLAYDWDKRENRSFAMSDISEWR